MNKIGIIAMAVSVLVSPSADLYQNTGFDIDKENAGQIEPHNLYAGFTKEFTKIATDGKKIETIEPVLNYATTRVNVRADASIESNILCTIKTNTEVYAYEPTHNWSEVILADGTQGYIYAEYLSMQEVPVNQLNRWNVSLTQYEKAFLANILWLEARGEGEDGQIAVCEVIFNRIASEAFPNNLYDVLSQKGQFTTWKQVNDVWADQEQYDVIDKALYGETNILSLEALYFSTAPLNSNIELHLGNHYFCKSI